MPSELTFTKTTINPTLLHRVCSAGGSHLLLFILENELKFPLTKEYLVNVIIIIHFYLFIFIVPNITTFIRWVFIVIKIKIY